MTSTRSRASRSTSSRSSRRASPSDRVDLGPGGVVPGPLRDLLRAGDYLCVPGHQDRNLDLPRELLDPATSWGQVEDPGERFPSEAADDPGFIAGLGECLVSE